MRKRFHSTAALLAAILAAQTLVGCGESRSGNKPDTSSPEQVSEETTADDSYHADYLPDVNYDGYVFRVVTMQEYPTDITEENGDIVNDAYYKRNRIIEEKYDIEFQETSYVNYWEPTDLFKKSTLAASDDFDLCRLIQRDAFALAVEGYVATPDMLPYADLTQPWYNQYLNEALSINGDYLLAYTDECIDLLMSELCIFFNKNIIDDLNLESPYTLVRDGTWTDDKFYEYAVAAVSDVDGNGKFEFDVDRFGVIAEHDFFVPSIWVGANVKTVEKDKDGVPYYSAEGNEKLYSILEKLNEFYHTDGNVCNPFAMVPNGEASRPMGRQSFANGHALFHVGGFGRCADFRSMNDDFGIVPLPKYDAEQESYYTRIIDAWINVAPVNAPDLNRTIVILEALAVESKNYVIPAIYDNEIKNKGIRDEDSLEMLEIIENTRTLDFGDTVWQGAIRGDLIEAVKNNKSNFASLIASKKNIVEKTINTALEQLEERQQ